MTQHFLQDHFEGTGQRNHVPVWSCATIPAIRPWTVKTWGTRTLHPLGNNFSLIPSPRASGKPLCFLWIWLLQGPQMSGILWHLSCCDWLNSLSVRSLGFVQVVCVRICMWGWGWFWCVFCLSVEGPRTAPIIALFYHYFSRKACLLFVNSFLTCTHSAVLTPYQLVFIIRGPLGIIHSSSGNKLGYSKRCPVLELDRFRFPFCSS